MAPPYFSRQALPTNRCPHPLGDYCGLGIKLRPHFQSRLFRDLQQLEALVLRPPTTRTWSKAPPEECPREVAGGSGPCIPARVSPRPHSFRRLPGDEPRQTNLVR